jgi:DNA-binding HxlR family transcriptional regulator
MSEQNQPTPIESGCIKAAAQILGAKWTPQLLYAMCHTPKRFSELQKEVEGLNPRTLSARLDGLERCGVVSKAHFNEVPPRIEYALTEKGKDLIPILQLMVGWSAKHAPGSEK